MLLALPSNGHCLLSHYLAVNVYSDFAIPAFERHDYERSVRKKGVDAFIAPDICGEEITETISPP
jgi:hypothetical protein